LIGHEIIRYALSPSGTRDITEVISKVLTVGGVTKMVYQPLTFAYPDIKEAEQDLPGITRATTMSGSAQYILVQRLAGLHKEWGGEAV
jgi:hypothetical protein